MIQVAKTQVDTRKKKSIVLTILVMSTGVISAVLLILFNQNQASQTPAATLPAPSVTVCSMKGNCQWDPLQIEGIVYTYTIIDKITGSTITSGRTSATRVDFDTRADHSYECTVAALSSCGQGEPVTNSCGSSQVVPKPAVTQTASTSAGISPTATVSATLVPTTRSEPTIRPSTNPIGGGSNPSATPVLIVQSTNTPGPSATKVPTSAPTTASGGSTTLPQAGTLLPTLGLLSVASLIIVAGLLL
jgi:hypothetical protein